MYSNEYAYLDNGFCTGFIKDYAGGDYALMALLPKEGVKVSEFAKQLTGEALMVLFSSAAQLECEAMLPKFPCDFGKTLNKDLEELGIKLAFSPKAQFGRISPLPVNIGEVIHKTFIEVNERGTRAGAVTSVMMKMAAMPIPRPKVYLDRPFVYAIVSKKQLVPLFIGCVNTMA